MFATVRLTYYLTTANKLLRYEDLIIAIDEKLQLLLIHPVPCANVWKRIHQGCSAIIQRTTSLRSVGIKFKTKKT